MTEEAAPGAVTPGGAVALGAVTSGEAWRAFCERLAAAGEVILAPMRPPTRGCARRASGTCRV